MLDFKIDLSENVCKTRLQENLCQNVFKNENLTNIYSSTELDLDRSKKSQPGFWNHQWKVEGVFREAN